MGKKEWLIKGIGSFLLIGFLLYKVKTATIITTLKEINILFLIPVILITVATILLGAANIYILFKAIRKSIQWKTIVHAYNLSWAFTLFAPGKTGEFTLLYFLKKGGIPIKISSVVFFFDKIITIVVTAAIAGSVILPWSLKDGVYLFLVVIIGIGLAVTLASKKKIPQVFPKRIHQIIQRSSEVYKRIIKNRKMVISNVGVTAVRSLCTFFSFYLLYLAFDTKVSFMYIIFFNTLLTLTSIAPFTLSGLGLREVSAVYLFSTIGVPPAITLNVYIINAVKKYIIAFFLILYSRLKF